MNLWAIRSHGPKKKTNINMQVFFMDLGSQTRRKWAYYFFLRFKLY
jgi:hypothetical protein